MTSHDGSAWSFPLLSDVPSSFSGSPIGLAERVGLGAGQLLALAILAALSPLMLALALLIRRDGGPALFVHYRVGCGGQLFRCIKFRTMRPNADLALREMLAREPSLAAEWDREHKLAEDPRVTPLGRWLRHSSLDELPQLLNVLRGEMALVGPRPVTVPELRRYGAARWQYLSVPPGITGLWQVSGRSRIGYDRRVELDERYVRTRSAWLDCRILAKTVVVVLKGDGAC